MYIDMNSAFYYLRDPLLSSASVLLLLLGWIGLLETWLRIGSLIVGIILAIYAIYRAHLDVKLKKRKLKNKDD